MQSLNTAPATTMQFEQLLPGFLFLLYHACESSFREIHGGNIPPPSDSEAIVHDHDVGIALQLIYGYL
jgi:hypothetical protein